MFIPVLVAALLVASPVLSEEGEFSDDQKDVMYCVFAAVHCAETHLDKYSRIRSLEELRQILANRSLVTEMAGSLQMTADCMERVQALPVCHGNLDWATIVPVLADFANSPGTIDKVVALSGSPCMTSEDVLRQAESAFNQCGMTFDQTWGDQLCGSLTQLWQCLGDHGNQLCGAVWGELYASWTQFILSDARRDILLAWVRSTYGVDFNSCEQDLLAHVNSV
ncbi:hypothetical protein ElyMa_004608900 [Elysia marginata]|uniref:Saposin B-type domain-containing protein n=1 Tax=Elysia marginata TaxID=1093978 RepID=A0AAV4I1E1_9GAST|nr:hypothetical protein ElyMa_004608900 [Elysia marginata]